MTKSNSRPSQREGFWFSESEPALPKPIPNAEAWLGQQDFLKWLKYKENASAQDIYRGFSFCRICRKPNGNGELKAGPWVWPSGYRHYIEEHNVRPSLAFQEYIEGKEIDV